MSEAELNALKELVAAAEAVVSLNRHPGRPRGGHTKTQTGSVDFIRASYEVWPRFHRAIETARLVLYPGADIEFGSPE